MNDSHVERPYKILTARESDPNVLAQDFARYAYYVDGQTFYYDGMMDTFEVNMSDLVEMETAKDAIAYARTNGADFVCFEDLGEIIWRRGDAHDDWTPGKFKVLAKDGTTEFDRLLAAYDFAMQHPDTVITHGIKDGPYGDTDVVVHVTHDGRHNVYVEDEEAHVETALYSFVKTKPNI